MPIVGAGAAGLMLTLLGAGRARADEVAPEYKAVIDKGLEWLKKQQNHDGHWEAMGQQYPVTMTAMAGMAMVMEGSTIRDGKYSDNIRKTVDWLMVRS
jgi:hypothetical protein